MENQPSVLGDGNRSLDESMSSHWNTLIEMLEDDHRVTFADGLSESEFHAIETRFDFRFPPDLREFLRLALPIGKRFPDWRNGTEDELRAILNTPLDGILFDVEHNGFWLSEWGERPEEFADAGEIVRRLVADAPTLIPIWAHRMMPDRPNEAGNPVFSVHQTDIIYYGCDLRDYFLHDFICKSDLGLWPMPEDSLRKIDFWDLERFATRWENGPVRFDNSKGTLP